MNRAIMKDDYTPLLNVGDIFSREIRFGYKPNKTEYWKVTGYRKPQKRGWMASTVWSYKVIKCSKNGKEYKETNGFSCAIDESLPNAPTTPTREHQADYNIVKRGTTVGEKANLDHGLQVGKTKRRIDYLVARIENDKAEVERLRNKLVELEYKKPVSGM